MQYRSGNLANNSVLMLADYWQNQTNQWVTLPIDYEKQKMFLPIFRYTFFCIPLFNLTGKLGKYFAEINKAQVLLQVIFFFFFFSFSSSSLGDTNLKSRLHKMVGWAPLLASPGSKSAKTFAPPSASHCFQ